MLRPGKGGGGRGGGNQKRERAVGTGREEEKAKSPLTRQEPKQLLCQNSCRLADLNAKYSEFYIFVHTVQQWHDFVTSARTAATLLSFRQDQ